jgi:hypothetical protein
MVNFAPNLGNLFLHFFKHLVNIELKLPFPDDSYTETICFGFPKRILERELMTVNDGKNKSSHLKGIIKKEKNPREKKTQKGNSELAVSKNIQKPKSMILKYMALMVK